MTLISAIEEYIKIRRALGADFTSAAKVLHSFGRAIGDIPLESIKAEQCISFCRGRRPQDLFRWTKYAHLKPFFRYLQSRGMLAVSPLPEAPRRVGPKFCAYIYSIEEIRRLLDAIPLLCCSKRWRLQPLTFRTILLLLYGAGLRIGEALSLRCCDLDLEGQVLTIRDTKFFKSRLVPIGSQLCKVLKDYFSMRKRLPLPDGEHSRFFVFRTGKPVTYNSIQITFAKLRKKAGIYRPQDDSFQPRIHDFRATFAVHRLTSWYRSGVNVQSHLPFLATYLGHKSIAGTMVYLTMTPALLTEAVNRFKNYAIPQKEHDNE